MFGSERLKLVYSDEAATSGRIERLDGEGRLVDAIDMALLMSSIPCFASGTAVATRTGPRHVEDLRIGDEVVTRDHGECGVVWVGQFTLGWRDLGANPILRPVRIRAGAFGDGLPERDLLVSPNHHMLVRRHRSSARDDAEAFVMARHLAGRPGIEVMETVSVTYFQILFSRHEVILAEGTWSESYLPDAAGLSMLNQPTWESFLSAYPEAGERGWNPFQAARETVANGDVASLVAA